jgi:hypothetical protein
MLMSVDIVELKPALVELAKYSLFGPLKLIGSGLTVSTNTMTS